MRPVRFPLLLVVGSVAVVLATAAPALATPAVLRLPAAELRAGETVELRWSGVPAECDELEILLSVDGGRTWPLRVSEELEPRAGGFRWRVPNLATGAARLRLRYGVEHRELDGAPTETFRIVADPDAPPARFEFHEGDWWEPFAREAAPRAADLDAPALAPATRNAEGTRPRSDTAANAPARAAPATGLAAGEAAKPARRPVPPPLTVPMRN